MVARSNSLLLKDKNHVSYTYLLQIEALNKIISKLEDELKLRPKFRLFGLKNSLKQAYIKHLNSTNTH